MKERRYFYTDPLAAAWMAKHFGMVFGSGSNKLTEPGDFTDTYENEYGCFPKNEADRHYIHPDSLHLLEPQVGDLCSFLWWLMGSDKAAEHHKLYDGGHLAWQRIIQRNGLAFHWPESDESTSA